MSASAYISAASSAGAAEQWHTLLRPVLAGDPNFPSEFLERLRDAKLTFGDRVHCPFLRPFFLSPEDERRVRVVAETIADLGERVVTAALEVPSLFAQLHLRPEETRLARLPVGYGRASTSSRLDAFLLPDSLKFAEYNGEAPAGAGYTETLAEVFRQLPIFDEFTRSFEAHSYPLSAKLLDALIASYIDWGGTDKRPQMAIVDWREVPTWTEFEILKSRFERMGVPVVLADPRDLEFNGKSLIAHGKKIDLLYRRVLINDIVARPQECAALVKAYEANAMCMTNTFRCKIPHVKAFFAVLTDEQNAKLFSRDEQQLIRNHIPWTRVVTETRTHALRRPDRPAPVHPQRAPEPRPQAQRRIRRHRRNARLGIRRKILGCHHRKSAGRCNRRRRRRMLDRAGTHPYPPRSFPLHHETRQRRLPRRFQRHARRFRALSFPRKTRRLPHPPQRHRPRQRHQRRRPSPRLPRKPAPLN